jgi:hypothetical protein
MAAAPRRLLTRDLFKRYCSLYQRLLFTTVVNGRRQKRRSCDQWVALISQAVGDDTGHMCAAVAARRLGFTRDQVLELDGAVPFEAHTASDGRLVAIRVREEVMWALIVRKRAGGLRS